MNQNQQSSNCSFHDIILNVEVMKETRFKECFIGDLIFTFTQKKFMPLGNSEPIILCEK